MTTHDMTRGEIRRRQNQPKGKTKTAYSRNSRSTIWGEQFWRFAGRLRNSRSTIWVGIFGDLLTDCEIRGLPPGEAFLEICRSTAKFSVYHLGEVILDRETCGLHSVSSCTEFENYALKCKAARVPVYHSFFHKSPPPFLRLTTHTPVHYPPTYPPTCLSTWRQARA